jgi:uncharacterized protein YuzE
MKVTYFTDTDTLLVRFAEGYREESKDLDENTLAEYDEKGNLLCLTLEHASNRADVHSFSYSQEPAEVLA